MIAKNPVRLDDSVVEINGEPLDCDWLMFWSDTFRQTDLLQYQDDSDVKMMIPSNPETTTYEFTIGATRVPEALHRYWHSGERFALTVENTYFDLDVDTAWVADVEDETVTIVAKVRRRGLAHV